MIRKFFIFLVLFIFSGCASSHVYREVMRDEPVYNRQGFSGSAEMLYEAVMRMLLNKQFMVEKVDRAENFILAKRSFQKGRKMVALVLQAKIVPEKGAASTLYLNAIETREANYVADRTRFFLWLIPLPGGGGKEATHVKLGEEMIKDKKFYKSLFLVIEQELEKIPLPTENALKVVEDSVQDVEPDYSEEILEDIREEDAGESPEAAPIENMGNMISGPV